MTDAELTAHLRALGITALPQPTELRVFNAAVALARKYKEPPTTLRIVHELGIGRTTVREAVDRLVASGRMVKLGGGRGVVPILDKDAGKK